FLGDGAGAFVVGRVPDGAGFVASHAVHTADTCGVFFPELVVEDGVPCVRMRADARAGNVLRKSSAVHLRACVDRVLAKADLTRADIDFFVFNPPTAWFADFAARALEIPRQRTISVYSKYANVGPVLMPANLHHALQEGKIPVGAKVLFYAV